MHPRVAAAMNQAVAPLAIQGPHLVGRGGDLLAGSLMAAALTLAFRRAAGAFENALPAQWLVVVALLVAATALLARTMWSYRSCGARLGWRRCAAHAALSAAALGIALTLSLPGTSPVGLIVLWTVLLAEQVFAWTWLVRPRLVAPRQDVLALAPDAVLVQQLIRTRSPDGSERISGHVRVPLVAGQRTAHAHVAFCPPLESVPRIEVDQLDGPESRIKAAQVLLLGVRFDVKLAGSHAADTNVLFAFSAYATTARSQD
jgi:hypothetical protein